MEEMKGTLLLTRSDLTALMDLDDYIVAMEEAFRTHGNASTFGIGMLHGNTPGELEFHIKAGGIQLQGVPYYGLKINASSFVNREKFGMPNIMGAILVFNGIHGFPLAIVDSIDPTIKRTGATTAVAAKYLAKKDSKIVTICGCGVQGQIQLQSLMKIFHFTEIFAYDIKPEVANEFAKKMEDLLETKINSTSNIAEACKKSDIIITCTPAKQPYIKKEYLKPGVFVAAVGSDAPQKQELEANIVSENKLIVDIIEQCARAGELHHAIKEGLMTIQQVHGSLGQVVTGQVTARTSDEEIIIYDATGTAIQDVAAAATCYEKAVKLGIGQYVNFFL